MDEYNSTIEAPPGAYILSGGRWFIEFDKLVTACKTLEARVELSRLIGGFCTVCNADKGRGGVEWKMGRYSSRSMARLLPFEEYICVLNEYILLNGLHDKFEICTVYLSVIGENVCVYQLSEPSFDEVEVVESDLALLANVCPGMRLRLGIGRDLMTELVLKRRGKNGRFLVDFLASLKKFPIEFFGEESIMSGSRIVFIGVPMWKSVYHACGCEMNRINTEIRICKAEKNLQKLWKEISRKGQLFMNFFEIYGDLNFLLACIRNCLIARKHYANICASTSIPKSPEILQNNQLILEGIAQCSKLTNSRPKNPNLIQEVRNEIFECIFLDYDYLQIVSNLLY